MTKKTIRNNIIDCEEITPEMALAGAEVIWSAFNDVMPWGSSAGESLAKEVFLAMASKSPSPRTNQSNQ